MPTTSLTSTKDQVRHIVAFKYDPKADIPEITAALKSLKDKIPGILAFEHGPNNSPESYNKGLTYVYILTFENASRRDEYLTHPEHKKFNEYLEKTGAVKDTLVVDFQIND